MYAKKVNDDGFASGLLGFGFDKAPSPRSPCTPPLLSRPPRCNLPPSPPTRQALNFAATSTMKYKVYLTCDGTTLTTGIMDLAVFDCGRSEL